LAEARNDAPLGHGSDQLLPRGGNMTAGLTPPVITTASAVVTPLPGTRNISKKLRIMESNDAARAMFDTLLENYIFYISPMYEFLHSQGQKLHKRPEPGGRSISAVPPVAEVNLIRERLQRSPRSGRQWWLTGRLTNPAGVQKLPAIRRAYRAACAHKLLPKRLCALLEPRGQASPWT